MDVGTVAQWRAAGISDARLAALVRTGQLVRLCHGVYATGKILAATETDPAGRHALEVAAVMAARPRGGVASHHSAAVIHGLNMLKRPPAGTVTLTVPPGARTGAHRSGGVVRHAADLPAEHVARRYAVLVTTAARTVVDLARAGTFMEGVVAADSALHRRVTTKGELRRVLERCGRWPGLAQARRVVDAANILAESVLESCARVVFLEHGLPEAELQVSIGGREFIGRVDFCWREHRTIAEADGLLTYKGPAEAVAGLRRDRVLHECGYEVVHFTWKELFRDPARLVARVRGAFR
jgi:very-short-patch-repair endonuclease